MITSPNSTGERAYGNTRHLFQHFITYLSVMLLWFHTLFWVGLGFGGGGWKVGIGRGTNWLFLVSAQRKWKVIDRIFSIQWPLHYQNYTSQLKHFETKIKHNYFRTILHYFSMRGTCNFRIWVPSQFLAECPVTQVNCKRAEVCSNVQT